MPRKITNPDRDIKRIDPKHIAKILVTVMLDPVPGGMDNPFDHMELFIKSNRYAISAEVVEGQRERTDRLASELMSLSFTAESALWYAEELVKYDPNAYRIANVHQGLRCVVHYLDDLDTELTFIRPDQIPTMGT